LFKIILSANDKVGNLGPTTAGLFELASRNVRPNMQNGHDRSVARADRALLSSWREQPDVQAMTAEWGQRLVLAEWEGDVQSPEHATLTDESQSEPISPTSRETSYRERNGWKGTDLVHSKDSPVRITHYFCRYGPGTDIRLPTISSNTTVTESQPPTPPQPHRGGAGTVLTGMVYFSPAAESHAGYCHGGSMCSIMDDAVGWVAFCCTGSVQPWTGFTVQVNTALRKPVLVASTLLVQAEIVRVERRKVMVQAKLFDPDQDNAVHATCEGVVVLNKGILHIE
jgi:acyl-coenzyme A thioesterase PaaI-like protein